MNVEQRPQFLPVMIGTSWHVMRTDNALLAGFTLDSGWYGPRSWGSCAAAQDFIEKHLLGAQATVNPLIWVFAQRTQPAKLATWAPARFPTHEDKLDAIADAVGVARGILPARAENYLILRKVEELLAGR